MTQRGEIERLSVDDELDDTGQLVPLIVAIHETRGCPSVRSLVSKTIVRVTHFISLRVF